MTYLKAGIEVLKLIHMNGYEAFFVGGFVRDNLLGLESNDIDIATNALPSQISNIFKVTNSGIKYNCVTIKYDEYSFETTTYRLEKAYHDNRHPVYETANLLVDDLKRRDFTINAMAMDVDLNVIDLFGGQEDLKNRLIRTVLNPQRRFTEDALRMLRAAYFAAKLDFEIDKDTLNAMRQCSNLVQSLTIDRICWELEKLFKSKHSLKGVNYLVQTNIAPYLKEFKTGIYFVNEQNLTDLTWEEFLMICFYDCVDKLNDVHFKSNISSKIKTAIELAKSNVKNNFSKLDLYENGLESILLASKVNALLKGSLNKSDEFITSYHNLSIKSLGDLAVRGQDIISTVVIRDNKQIGIILDDVLKMVINNKLPNDKENILKYIKKHY